MGEQLEIKKVIMAYKQTTGLLIILGILLGSYTITGTGIYNSITALVAILAVAYGAYNYYKMDAKIGLFLVIIALLWVLGYVLTVIKVI